MQLKMNPVLKKELKLTTRTWKIALTLLVYSSILALLGLLIFDQMIKSLAYSSGYQQFTSLYIYISVIQFGLILFIVPALTAGSISGERERQTLEIILSTPLRPFSLLLGKLLSSISTVILLVLASAPVLSFVFIFGGVTITQLLGLLLYYIVTVVFIGSIGIFFSTIFKRTTVSNVMTYGCVIALIIGTIIISAVSMMYFERRYGYYTPGQGSMPKGLYILYINPLLGFFSVISEQLGTGSGIIGNSFLVLGNDITKTWIINVIVELGIAFSLLYLASLKLSQKKAKLFKMTKGKKINQE
ncbi:MAG: ABC transporter permease [Eubacteriales bacterium]